MMNMCKIVDMYGTELECGDMVCFVENSSAGWKQTKRLARVQIKAFVSDKSGDYILYNLDGPKVKTSKVIKCY